MTWQYAQRRFPKKLMTDVLNSDFGAYNNSDNFKNSNNGMYSVDKLLGLACIESLFRVRGLPDLLKKKKRPSQKPSTKESLPAGDTWSKLDKQLHARSLCWHKALRDRTIPIPEPFHPDNYPVIYNVDDMKLMFHVDNSFTRVNEELDPQYEL
jgi:hypothetical protein